LQARTRNPQWRLPRISQSQGARTDRPLGSSPATSGPSPVTEAVYRPRFLGHQT
jgi:hypothetical protein